MNKVNYILFVLALLLWSCDENSTTIHTLEKESFTTVGKDSMIMYIESAGAPVHFTGKLELVEGECTLTLKAPLPEVLITTDTTFVYDTIFSIDSIYPTGKVLSVDTIYNADTLFAIDTTFITDTIFSIDSVFLADTIFTPDTTILYGVIFQKTYTATNTFTFDEKFDRVKGKWTFNYELNKLNDVSPEGSFNFVLKYAD